MNLFGCKFCQDNVEGTDGERQCDRKNFDSLLWALVTVFQVDFFLFCTIFCNTKKFQIPKRWKTA